MNKFLGNLKYMTINGFASINGTKLFSDKFTELKYNSLGKTGLLVSEIGFGSYRIDIRSPLNRDALKKAGGILFFISNI